MSIENVTEPSRVNAPEFFRLPAKGPDPFFGLTRSYYYALEQAGRLKLVRIRNRGCQRGITLVPYDRVLTFLKAQEVAA